MLDDAPLDAAAALELLTRQQLDVDRRLAAGLPLILFAWGIAWTVGFGMLWLIDGLAPGFRMPLPARRRHLHRADGRRARRERGRSARGWAAASASSSDAAWTGTVYGLTWPVGYIGLWALGSALLRGGMPPDLAEHLLPDRVGDVRRPHVHRRRRDLAQLAVDRHRRLDHARRVRRAVVRLSRRTTSCSRSPPAASSSWPRCFTAIWIGREIPPVSGWGRGR